MAYRLNNQTIILLFVVGEKAASAIGGWLLCLLQPITAAGELPRIHCIKLMRNPAARQRIAEPIGVASWQAAENASGSCHVICGRGTALTRCRYPALSAVGYRGAIGGIGG